VTLDDEDIERIARRVAELVGARHPNRGPRYVDAAYLAGLLDVERDWVYAHARELGAIRLGSGAHGRLRFDLQQLAMTVLAPAEREPSTERATGAHARRPRRRVAGTDVIAYEH
jgi:hypothetical protein